MEDDKITEDMYKKVVESVGYKNISEALDIIFKDSYKVVKIIPDEDTTSYDFREIVNINDFKGIDIGIVGSGNSHQFQTGDGIVSIGLPSKEAFGRLITGEQGESLARITKDDSIKFGASANNLGQVKEYFLKLKDYLKAQAE